MTHKVDGTLYTTGINNDGVRIHSGGFSTDNIHRDTTLISQALMFRDAAKRRDDVVFVCTLVPKWKRIFLRILKIKVENV